MNDDIVLRHTEDTRQVLQDLVIASAGLADFLDRLVEVAAAVVPGGHGRSMASVIVLRPRTKAAIAGTCPAARTLTAIQHRFDDGPCIQAGATDRTVRVEDFAAGSAFPLYGAAAVQRGMRSGLSVPVRLDGPETAVLTYYSREPNAFHEEEVGQAELLAGRASTPLAVAVRLARLTDRTEQLTAAMESRTTIDLAAGVIMAHQRCTQDEAIGILRAASSAQNMRLRDLASTVLRSTTDTPITTHFD
ncbi:GAF and ANTAR domain-containing protein [Arthrobacter agilis]|uniref:GAF and ANTAR domain-containing protein n=1 Tax=Arthrobacter agilis TaxID=37921 RepID=UPI0027869780|nr:GAF and ANTAR domain-containing protein [Arthrobacter agilis]MDQ0733869.1 GAF domain-containing protein [Arthrobacter agilis]